MAKQSRIKSIVLNLRWLVRTKADISLWPSGLHARTDIKLRQSALVRTRTDIKLWHIGLVRSYVQGLNIHANFLNCHYAAF